MNTSSQRRFHDGRAEAHERPHCVAHNLAAGEKPRQIFDIVVDDLDFIPCVLDARNNPASGFELLAIPTCGDERHAQITQVLHHQATGVTVRAIDHDGVISG